MTATEQPAVDLREPAGWRRTKNQIATVVMVLAFVIVLIPLGFVLFTVIDKGASAISWSFLTGSIPPVAPPVPAFSGEVAGSPSSAVMRLDASRSHGPLLRAPACIEVLGAPVGGSEGAAGMPRTTRLT